VCRGARAGQHRATARREPVRLLRRRLGRPPRRRRRRRLGCRPRLLDALDPIATAKVEELIHELKKQFTIIIVTHSMQQAARCSDRTAFFYMGKLIEFDETHNIFMNPKNAQTEAYVSGRFG
jgi:hypothetical protein